jgi:hypothetical protein
MQDQFLKPEELAARWRTTVGTLKTQRYRGRGPAYVKNGRSVLYKLSVIEAYELAQTRGKAA